jgi:hypothetical protein
MTNTLRTTWTGLLMAQFAALPLPFFVEGVVVSAAGMTFVAALAGAVAFAALLSVETRFATLLGEQELGEVASSRVERTLTACWLLAATVGALGLLVGTLTGSVLLASPFLVLAAMAMVETRPSHPKLVPLPAFANDRAGARQG